MSGLRVAVLVFVVVLCVAGPAAAGIINPEHQDPPPEWQTGGGGGGCTYCSQSNCGCAAAPAGMRLSRWSCTCSSSQCTQDCDYVPL
ncbi:MAG TPA: hypothetical protein VFN10_17705 [Thermoanaerobaculia bacterium]|nr:hypothetical protein [Thermoanaerobaculia bacterium]